MIIAIHPDNYGPGDASSPRWTALLQERGHTVRPVNVRAADILEQIKGCDGFMWRWAHFNGMFRIAHRLLPVIERELGLAVYPSQASSWHYDDKISQSYLGEALGIPMPKTWVFFHPEEARRFIDSASFPLVVKLSGGAGSSNVGLVHSADQAMAHVRRMFSRGCYTLNAEPTETRPEELQFGYALFQEFLPGNEFDTRVTIIGNRAYAYRRFNRPNDFRASGSGNRDADPNKIDLAMVRLAFETTKKLRSQSCAVDGIYRNGTPVASEFSYTYVSQFIFDCPGHWELIGHDLKWVEGPMWPEEAQIDDFVGLLEGGMKERGCHE
jgi:hypothetical protein